jgi:hypothetical protein
MKHFADGATKVRVQFKLNGVSHAPSFRRAYAKKSNGARLPQMIPEPANGTDRNPDQKYGSSDRQEKTHQPTKSG